ncbi:hypothetical protein [Helicobacter pylori]
MNTKGVVGNPAWDVSNRERPNRASDMRTKTANAHAQCVKQG